MQTWLRNCMASGAPVKLLQGSIMRPMSAHQLPMCWQFGRSLACQPETDSQTGRRHAIAGECKEVAWLQGLQQQ